ncbi:MAG: hypothetical protein K8S54_06125 [Spirochaetia bacterium]|nr:hypothetical protein [Spirochaetia bacterium]
MSFNASSAILAFPFEIGMTGSAGFRSPSSFDTGLENFRTSLSPTVIAASKHSSFNNMPSAEGWFRIGDVISDQSFFGLMFGRTYAPDISIRQFRSDGVYFTSKWNFLIPYFGLTYHYRFRPLESRHWSYEVGGTFGFVTEPRWRTDGYYQSRFQLSRLQTSHRAAYGSLLRVEGAVLKSVGDYVFLRAGLSHTFMYMGRFSGNVNGNDGYWVNLRNGGLFPLAASQFLQTFAVDPDPILGPTQVSLIRKQTELSLGISQIFVSVGFRF